MGLASRLRDDDNDDDDDDLGGAQVCLHIPRSALNKLLSINVIEQHDRKFHIFFLFIH